MSDQRPGCGSRKPRFVSRRDFLFKAGEGISGVALAWMLAQDGLLAASNEGPSCDGSAAVESPLTPRPSHFAPKAKSVISLFMSGGVSHIDTFDYKPMLAKYHGQPLSGKGEIRVRQGFPGPLMKSPFEFKKYGQSGIEVSELFPHVGGIVDDIALIRSGQGRSNDHVLAHYEWNTGSLLMGFPSVGSWVTYGLGSENQNLPGFVVIYDHRGGPFSGPANWSSGFLPATYQGTVFRSTGDPILDLTPPDSVTAEQQRARLDHLGVLNEQYAKANPGSSDLAARIASYELAYRMQACAPEAVNINDESEATKRLYGLDDPVTEPFGRQCLLARRLVERGVRFVQLFDWGWDTHGTGPGDDIITQLPKKCRETDRPVAALVTDLEQRGLLDETLVIWSGEFGRTAMNEKRDGSTYLGRDHHPHCFTMWMAGGGVRAGTVYGATDELGYSITENPVDVHDLQATILRLMGLDHERLTYRFQGRDYRLTDVFGTVVDGLMA
jgi:hypothetical protein